MRPLPPSRSILASFLFALLFFTGAPLRAVEPQDFSAFRQFSADFSMSSGGQTMTGSYYRDGDKLRMEPKSMTGGGGAMMPGMAMIIDLGAKSMMMIMPQQQMYMVTPLGGPMAGPVPKTPMDSQSVVSRKQIGKETVDGHPTVIEEVTVKDRDGTPQTFKVWSATDLKGFPVRTEAKDERGQVVTMNFTHVKLSAPDAKLFQAPAGYQRMEMPTPGMAPGMVPGMYPPQGR